MFGQYALFCDGNMVALICDDQLFIKPTIAGRSHIGVVTERLPYKGAKPYFWISGDHWEDSDWLTQEAARTSMTQPLSSIRPTTAGDTPALKAVIDATGLFPSDMLDDMLAGFLKSQGGDEIWLTDHDVGPVALAYCAPERMTQGTWNLYLIAVHPDRQGKGRGTALLRHVEQALAERGERVLLVETSGLPAFERTRAFYRQCGYDEEARIRDFYQAGEDKIVFRKALMRGTA
jgi:ribosomal protein S18 acetylase RimI-like enzyme